MARVENGAGRGPVPLPGGVARQQMLGVCARQRRPFRAQPVMEQLTCTHFSGLVRPVLKHRQKSLTVGQGFFVGAKPASAFTETA